jgi:hypothetical protein
MSKRFGMSAGKSAKRSRNGVAKRGFLSRQAAKQERGMANVIKTQRVILPAGRTGIRYLRPELTVPFPPITDARVLAPG